MSGKKKEINPIIGKRIKQSRERLLMEQQELAKRMNLTKSAVSKIESGIVDVNSSSLEKYSKILDVSVNYLLGVTNDPSPTPHIIAANTGSIDGKPVPVLSQPENIIRNPKKDILIKLIQEGDIPDETLDGMTLMIQQYKK